MLQQKTSNLVKQLQDGWVFLVVPCWGWASTFFFKYALTNNFSVFLFVCFTLIKRNMYTNWPCFKTYRFYSHCQLKHQKNLSCPLWLAAVQFIDHITHFKQKDQKLFGSCLLVHQFCLNLLSDAIKEGLGPCDRIIKTKSEIKPNQTKTLGFMSHDGWALINEVGEVQIRRPYQKVSAIICL